MKRAILLLPLALTACNTVHTGVMGLNVSDEKITVPLQVNLDVDDQTPVVGVASCPSVLWMFNSAPSKRAYGTELQTTEGNFASNACTAAAVYDAIDQTSADILVAPQYKVVQKGALCFGSRCLAGTTRVSVTGYPAKIKSITKK